MAIKVFFLLFISICVKLGFTKTCQHKLDGESGIIKYPVSNQSDKLPNFASKGDDSANTCLFFKNIDKKKLSLKFKRIAINGESIKIQTIKTTRKLTWKTYKNISGKTKNVIINIKGFRYVRISVTKKSGSFEMEYTLTVPPVATCQEFSKSVKPVRCTKGIKAGSRCSLSCVEEYTPNQYIKKSAGTKFTVTCRKISARKGVWKPTLNRIVCGKGQKTKKECKKKFELCVPTTSASPQTTLASTEPDKIDPELSRSTIEVFTTLAATSSVVKHISTSKSKTATTKQINVTSSPDLKSQSSTKLSAQSSTTRAESLASSRGTEVPRILVPSNTSAAMTPTIINESTYPTATYTKKLQAETLTMRPTPSTTTSEPTPPPLHILFLRFPELNPDFKGPESDKQPQSTEGLNPTRHAPLVTAPSSSTTALENNYNPDESHVETSSQESERQDKLSPLSQQSNTKNQSTVTEEGRGQTSPPTPFPTLTNNLSSQLTSKSLKTEQGTRHPHQSTAPIQTTEAHIFIKSSIAPKLTTVSTTTTTTRTSTTKPPPLTTTSTTTRKTPAPNKQVVSVNGILKKCRKRFCGLSIVTRKYARTCQSYGVRVARACRFCRSHPAGPCSTTMSFP